jgi:hypothetical protein
MAAQKGDQVTVEGIVVAINSKALGNKYNHLFLADASLAGGYYCYSITADPEELGIKVGMTVKVAGPMEPYSGMQEIKGGQASIIDQTIKTVEPVDITAPFTAGENLGVYVGMPVVIKGVSIGTQDLVKDTSQYLYFNIGEQSGYVRTYVTDFPTSLPADTKGAIDADHAEHFGYTADATGILILYNGAPYLIPMSVDCFNYIEKIEKTPEQKVDDVIATIKLPTVVNKDGELALPTTSTAYPEVTIAWASNNAAAVIGWNSIVLVTNTNLNPLTENQSLYSVLNVVEALFKGMSVNADFVQEIVAIVKCKAKVLLCWVNARTVWTGWVGWLPPLIAVVICAVVKVL